MPSKRLLIIVNINCGEVRNLLDTFPLHENVPLPVPHKKSFFAIFFVVVRVYRKGRKLSFLLSPPENH